jgi:hypothetical protein
MSYIETNNKVLLADEVFTSKTVKLEPKYLSIHVSLNTDKAGTLKIYQSQFNKHYDFEEYDIQPGTSYKQIQIKGVYFYVVYENGNEDQSYFHLVIRVSEENVSLGATLQDSLMYAKNQTTGATTVLRTDNDGKLLVSGSGGGGGGDATAANQLEEIGELQELNTKTTISNINLESIRENIATHLTNCDTDNVIINSSNPVNVLGLAKVENTLNNAYLTVDSAQNLKVTVANQNDLSNLATETTATTIKEASVDTLEYVEGITNRLTPLPIYSAKYTLDAVSTLAPDTTPTFKEPPSQFLLDEGWYFKNTSTNQPSQIYYYSWLNPALQPPARQKTYTLGEVSGGYCVVNMLSVNNTAGLVMLGIYTQPTGSGDAIPGFAKSRKVYTIPTGSNLTQGQKVLLYWGIPPDTRIYGDIVRIQLNLATSIGPCNNSENLAYLTLNTDSGATAGNTEYIVSQCGFIIGGMHLHNTKLTSELQEPTLTINNNVRALDVNLNNQISGYSTEEKQDDLIELIQNQSQYNRFQVEALVSDGKLDTIINNMSLTNFNINNLTKCDTDNVAIPAGVSINNLLLQVEDTTTHSKLDSISSNMSATAFNVNGLSTCNTNDVYISNFPATQSVSLGSETVSVSDSMTHTELGNIRTFLDKLVVDIKSPETTGALLVKVDNQLSQPLNVIADSKTQDGEGNIITSTQEGTIKRGLDVNLINKNLVGYSQIATDSSITTSGPIGTLADTQGYLYVGVQFLVSNWSTQGGGHSYDHPVYIQFSADGGLWTNGNSVTVSGDNTYSIIVSGVNPFRYVRLYADMGTHQPSYTVNAWLSQK